MCRGNKSSADTKASSSATGFQGADLHGRGGQASRPNAWEWQCGMCTLINRPCNDTCEMCGFPRGTVRSVETAPWESSETVQVAACEHTPAKGLSSASTSDWSSSASSPQSPGQQILASLKQKVDSASFEPTQGIFAAPGTAADLNIEPRRIDAGYEILAALKCGAANARPGGHRPALDPSQELLATLKSGRVDNSHKAGLDSSQQLLAVLKSGGDASARGYGTDLLFVVDGHCESGRPRRKAARRGRRGAHGGGDRPMYSQAA